MKNPVRLLLTSFFTLLFICAFSATPTVTTAQAQTVDEAIAVVEKHYQELVDLHATVSQKTYSRQ